MKKELIVITVLASTIIGTVLFTMRFGMFFDPSISRLNFSRHFTFTTYNSSALLIGSDLFVVSSYPSCISIESTNWDYSNCTIMVDEKDKITDRFQSDPLGDRILVWSFSEDNYQHFLLLDPWNCSYRALLNRTFLVPIEVISNQDHFDIFSPNEKCLPCRFNDNGKEIKLQNQIQPENVPTNSTLIKAFFKSNAYAYAINLKNNTSILKILDQDFNTLKQTTTSFHITNLALTYVSFDMDNFIKHFVTNIFHYSLNHRINNRQNPPNNTSIGVLHHRHISMFDLNLQPVFTVRLPHAYKTDISMDSCGNSLVISRFLGDIKEKYHLARYDATGQLDYEVVLDEYQRGGNVHMQSFLINDREYCLVNHREANKTNIKCIDISKL